MIFQHEMGCAVQSRLHSLQLVQNIYTISFLFNHALNSIQVSDSLTQPVN